MAKPRKAVVFVGLLIFVILPMVGIGHILYRYISLGEKGNTAFQVGQDVAGQIEDYYNRHGRLPENLGNVPMPSYVDQSLIRAIEYDPKSGSVRVSLSFTPVEGDYFRLIPHHYKGGIVWFCEPVCGTPDCIKLYMGGCINSMADRSTMPRNTQPLGHVLTGVGD